MSQESVKQALLGTINAIQETPSIANVVFRADTHWEEDVRCRVNIKDFPPMMIDEPPELGGQDSAPNPVELVLAALGTCQEIMYSAYASVMGVQLDSVSVSAKGYLDLHGLFGMKEDVPAGYQRVTFETKLNCTASDEDIQALIDTVESHCPVLDILTTAQQVTGTVIINDGARTKTLSMNVA